ncbi:acyl-CoA dehydrogenase [Nocardioides sp. Kera G14]|uniref:acyl-CoA dehydrogenase n=1 Tax=Nocardioides sp. Kera G14 TaxID=2884264 RepID=UPI001D10FAE5|nr:acyl-CoA dehydrogenase [Nocardioides sp. Kera G14]UDY23247.1 acyl-CoA dehydrogenase [Nocardioides sp. Kera G14]
MSHYKSNLRDIEFNLFEVFGTDKLLGTGPWAELDIDTAKEILAEVERISREDLAASFEDSDRNPPVFDPTTNTAPVPASFKKSYDTWMESGFWSLQAPEEIGGTPAPSSLVWATAEMICGANAPIWMYGAGPFFSRVVFENGNERDKRIAEIMVEKLWGATMVLTEPDAGSDVGAGKTYATPNEDGSWNISGVKRFITSAESDLQENIMHLVLARPRGVEGVGGPGTKGLSLFLVPKYHFDHETGDLTGERNGAYVTNVEHKMGIKVSNTCEVTFGDPQIGGGEPAKGWLLGEVHDGIRQMFDVIENARMMVGTKAIATLSTGYLNALEYAKTRVQGADLTNPAKDAPRVTITHHPDVRRSLLVQKSYAEGMRALIYLTTSWQDKILQHKADGTTDSEEAKLAVAVNDLLLPIVKGYGSEKAWTLLGTESLQTFGGSGFLQEYPIEQYVRDAKIDSIYEGTTAIQGQDFFFRKIVKDQGKAIGQLSADIKAFLAEDGNAELKASKDLLAKGLEDVEGIVGHMFTDLMSAQDEINNIYKVAQNTSRLLLSIGDVVIGWLLLKQAEIAANALATGASQKDTAFYQGKVAAAKFFASYTLPKIAAERAIAEAVDNSLMEFSEDIF